MATYGEKLGIVFQIVDDILDVTSPPDTLGKASGQDIKERKPSIVNILWIDSGSKLAKRLLSNPTGDEREFIADAITEIKSGDVIKKAADIAVQYAQEAIISLETAVYAQIAMKPSTDISQREMALEQLRQLTEYVIHRVY